MTRFKVGPLTRFLSREQPFADSNFVPGDQTLGYLDVECAVLVIGAGGLGCEILKNLAFSGFKKIHLIDADRIAVSNLNRQFLFREGDVGQFKAIVAAEYINCNFKHLGCLITPHVGLIQSFDPTFYDQFNLIISGLDNVEARRWINSQLHQLVEIDVDTGEPRPETIKPLLDGGTEGFKGQTRVILPHMTSCFECSLSTLGVQTNFPLCTIAETPRLPEHCIQYASTVLWQRCNNSKNLDVEDPEHLSWVFTKARERAALYRIEGVTYDLCAGVLKRIVPAVASTNALIAASLVTEALKLSTYCAPVLNNYMMYMGHGGVYTFSFEYAKSQDCIVCSNRFATIAVPSETTLRNFLVMLKEHGDFLFERPSLNSATGIVFVQRPAELRMLHEYKLDMSLLQLISAGVFENGEVLRVSDPALHSPFKLRLLVS